jgi:filamentous hemagglutinin family protein
MKKLLAFSVMVYSFCANISSAQIALDGSMGQKGPLTGPNYIINAGMGSLYGSNLFHSFGVFNVNTGESATFIGPAAVQNVIGRVTGGAASNIDGNLSCSIQGANLYLINPAGMMFGPNATLDVTGSFVATTANYVKLSDGGRFDATNPSASVLTLAPVSAFGFLDGNIGAITVDRSYLKTADGKSLSLIGGDINVTNGYIVAPGGRIDLVSAASKGEVLLSGATAPDVSSFSKLGNISITHDDPNRLSNSAYPIFADDGSTFSNSLANIDTSGESGGAIYIRGGQFVMDRGLIYADTYGSKNGSGIDIDVTGNVKLENRNQPAPDYNTVDSWTYLAGSTIQSGTYSEYSDAGRGGNILIKAGSVDLRDFASISAMTNGPGAGGDINITTGSLTCWAGDVSSYSLGVMAGAGNAGKIVINAVSVDLENISTIGAQTYGLGAGGEVNINSDSLALSASFISTSSIGGSFPTGEMYGIGNGGKIIINAGSVDLKDGSSIEAWSWGPGSGGDINITAGSVTLSGASSFNATSGGEMAGAGNGGNIIISAGSVDLKDLSSITAATWGSGKGGDIAVKANSILLDGGTPNGYNATGIYASANSAGDGGSITVDTRTLTMTNGAQISVSAWDSGKGGDVAVKANSILLDGMAPDGTYVTGIYANTYSESSGAGDGGSITVDTGSLTMTNTAEINARAWGAGKAGDIRLNVANLLSISSGYVSTSADQSSGGSITINGGAVILTNASSISSSVFSGEGGGGNVTINSMNLLALDKSDITANATDGRGGNAYLNTDAYIHSADSVITANSNKQELQGTVIIQSPALDISGSLGSLTANYTTGAVMASDRCAARSFENASSFTIGGRDGIPLDTESAILWRMGNKDECGGMEETPAGQIY